jgi:hypothetical protein
MANEMKLLNIVACKVGFTQRRSEIFGATGTLLLSFRLAEACARIQRLHQVAWLGRE